MDDQQHTSSRPVQLEAAAAPDEPTVWEYLVQMVRTIPQRLFAKPTKTPSSPAIAEGTRIPVSAEKPASSASAATLALPAENVTFTNRAIEPAVSYQVLPAAPDGTNQGDSVQVQFSVRLPPGTRLNITLDSQRTADDASSTTVQPLVTVSQQNQPYQQAQGVIPERTAKPTLAMPASLTQVFSRFDLKEPLNLRAERKISPQVMGASFLLTVFGLWLLLRPLSIVLRAVNVLFLLNGILIFLFATRLGEDGEQSLWDWLTRDISLSLGVAYWQKVCLCISPCLTVVAVIAAGQNPVMVHPFVAVVAWLGAIVLAIVGGWQKGVSWHRPERLSVFLLLGLTLAALALRSFDVAHIPSVLTGDEASSGLSGVSFAKGEVNNIFTIGWFSFPAMFYFLQGLAIRIFGQSIDALRLFAALGGALTVGAVYVVGRNLFNHWAGVFAALFLTFFHYHNHFSRIGLNNIWDGLWFTVVLGLLWYGWEKQSRIAFLWCGFSLGLAQYFYITSRALFVLVPLYMVIMALLDRQRARARLPDMVLMGLSCLVTVLPLAFFFIRFPTEFYAPLQRATILGEWLKNAVSLTGQSPLVIILRQIGLSVSGLYSEPLRAWYEPQTPLLRPVSAVVFFIGLLFMLPKWRQGFASLLWMWLGAIILAGGLSENTPAAQRYVAVAPVVALIIGFGLAEAAQFLAKTWSQRARWFYGALLVFLLVVGVDELKFYYLEYTPRAYLGGDNGLIAQNLADYLKTKDANWQVVFYGWPRMGYYSFSTLPYLAPQIIGVDHNQPWGSAENPPITGNDLIFVFLPEHLQDLQAAQAQYPNGQLFEETNRGATLYWRYEVSAVP
jgi:4-amino-4-deoxy-L-arabinose transferase-like glycosyltransferase